MEVLQHKNYTAFSKMKVHIFPIGSCFKNFQIF